MSHDIESQVVAGQDGNVRKLTAAGYKVIAQHGGSEGWKDIDGKHCFVDHYGGVWAISKPLNIQAAELRAKLFDLQNEFSDLGQAVIGSTNNPVNLRIEANQQIEKAMYAMREIYESLGDVFTDAYRDAKDQAFGCTLARD